jgi:hypothetical protein
MLNRCSLILACTAALVFVNIAVKAQLSIGPTGMFIGTNTIVTTDRLTLQPTSDLLLANVDITKSATPVVSGGGNSIDRVYSFSQPISLTGTIGLFFEDGELDGNTEASLALVYRRAADNVYVTATGSSIDLDNNYVSLSMTGIPIIGITAVNNNVTLPITISEFTAGSELDKVKLEWQTTYEQQNDRFEIERSTDGINFTVIATIEGANVLTGHRYVSYDYHPVQGVNFYRLVQYDIDGAKKNYGIRKVVMGSAGKVVMIAYPNPTTNNLNISLQNYSGDKIHTALYNLQGSLISTEDIQMQQGRNTYPINLKTVPSRGDYILKVTGDNGFSRVVKISIQ